MKVVSLLLLFLYQVYSYADTCSHVYTPHHLLNEAIQRNIHLELKQLENKSLEGNLSDANKIYNPEFEHFTTTGDQVGKNNITSESRIWFNLQLNNKREKKWNLIYQEKQAQSLR